MKRWLTQRLEKTRRDGHGIHTNVCIFYHYRYRAPCTPFKLLQVHTREYKYYEESSDDLGGTHSFPNVLFNNDSIAITRVDLQATDPDPHLPLIPSLSDSEARKN